MYTCAVEDKTAVVAVALYRSTSRNLVCFKALLKIYATDLAYYLFGSGYFLQL